MKKIIILLIISIGIGMYFPMVRGEFKSFERGDSIYFNNKIIVATVASGDFEIFAFNDNVPERKIFIGQDDGILFVEKFKGVVLRVEDENLFAYLVSSRNIYKYNLTDIDRINLTLKKKLDLNINIISIDKNNKFIYSTERGRIRTWDENLNEITAYDFNNQAINFKIANTENLIFGINEGKVFIYSISSGKILTKTDLKIKGEKNRAIYLNEKNEEFYIVDDEFLNIINYDGDVVSKFKHASFVGYDAFLLDNNIVFTDGIGVVILKREDITPSDWLHTETIKSGNGWAMGLNYIEEVKKFVLFNNSEILLLDNDLSLISSVEMDRELEFDESEVVTVIENEKNEEEPKIEIEAVPVVNIESEVVKEDVPEVRIEGLYLSGNNISSGSYIDLSGVGLMSNEDVVVSFLDEEFNIVTELDGTFKISIQVPPALPGTYNIKVVGLTSERSYDKELYID